MVKVRIIFGGISWLLRETFLRFYNNAWEKADDSYCIVNRPFDPVKNGQLNLQSCTFFEEIITIKD